MAYKNSEEGIIARANAAVRKRDILTQAAADGRLQQPMSQDQLDRVSIGLPPSDPIPVNTPLDANGQPLQQPQSAPQSPRPVAPPLPQQPTPQAPPGAPQGAPQGGPQAPAGWLDHYSNHLLRNGIVPSTDVIGKALGGLVASGQWKPDFADHLLSNPTQFLGDRSVPFQQAIAQAQTNAGMTPSPIVPEIKSPQQHLMGAINYQTLGSNLQNMAAQQGDQELASAILRIRTTSSLANKLAIYQQLMASRQNDMLALDRAKNLLPPELFKGKK
jgi:hypothetical protein